MVTALCIGLHTLPLFAAVQPAGDVIVTTVVTAKFDDVIDSLIASIQSYGASVAHVVPAQKVLAASASHYNEGKQHFLAAQTIEFCSPRLSHALLNESPDYLVFCPMAISVYELPSQPGQIHLSYRNPQISGTQGSVAVLVSMKDFMDAVVDDGTQWFVRVK